MNFPDIKNFKNLKFSWNAPDQSNCEDFNAVLDGYEYEFKGISPWVKSKFIKGDTNSFSTDYAILKSFTQYDLSVFVRSLEGSYNPEFPLKFSARTEPAEQAGRPRELTVVEINDGSQHRAGWLPPYPPTGIAERYQIQWKEPKSDSWANIIVNKPFQKCVKTFLDIEYSISSFEEYQTRICHTLNVTGDVATRMNTTYRVVAFNQGSFVSSDPSNSVFPITEEGNMGLTIFFIVLGIVLLILLISLAFVFIRKYTNRQL